LFGDRNRNIQLKPGMYIKVSVLAQIRKLFQVWLESPCFSFLSIRVSTNAFVTTNGKLNWYHFPS